MIQKLGTRKKSKILFRRNLINLTVKGLDGLSSLVARLVLKHKTS